MKKHKIIVVDDHQQFRSGLKSILSKNNFIDVIGEAANGFEFLKLLDSQNPDIVFMDIDMPQMNGIEAVKEGLKKNPDLKFIVLSMFGDEYYYSQMIQAGAKAFVLKTSNVSDLLQAVKEVALGKNYFSNDLLRSVVFKINKIKHEKSIVQFNDRELEIINAICAGFADDEIAEKNRCSVLELNVLKTNILEKANCKNTAGLIIYAIKNKLVEI